MYARGSIPGLLFRRSPAAVLRRVVAVIVHSVDRVLHGRASSHVGQERREVSLPARADGNSTSAVAVVAGRLRIRASVQHRAPRSVLGTCALWVALMAAFAVSEAWLDAAAVRASTGAKLVDVPGHHLTADATALDRGLLADRVRDGSADDLKVSDPGSWSRRLHGTRGAQSESEAAARTAQALRQVGQEDHALLSTCAAAQYVALPSCFWDFNDGPSRKNVSDRDLQDTRSSNSLRHLEVYTFDGGCSSILERK
jgi:hypothetical protein